MTDYLDKVSNLAFALVIAKYRRVRKLLERVRVSAIYGNGNK